jgi:hypothetical protein
MPNVIKTPEFPDQRFGTVMHREDCGCTVTGWGTLPEPWRPVLCPLHAAASTMLEVLKGILPAAEQSGFGHPFNVHYHDACGMECPVIRARELIIPPATTCPKCSTGHLVADERPTRFGFTPVKCDECGSIWSESKP